MQWIVLPTRNEAAIIRATLERVVAFLRATCSDDWRIIVADNGSTDATRAIVRTVCRREPRVELLEFTTPGKGNAVLRAWERCLKGTTREPRGVYIFMDADLATDLRHLPDLVGAIMSGADVAIGSRYAAGAQVTRGIFRRFVSHTYHSLLRLLFGLHVADAPCGCKAVSPRVVRDVVPKVRDGHWFFDTELLIRTQVAGFRTIEIPVTWSEPRRGAAVGKVLRIIRADLPAMFRLWWELRRAARASSRYTR